MFTFLLQLCWLWFLFYGRKAGKNDCSNTRDRHKSLFCAFHESNFYVCFSLHSLNYIKAHQKECSNIASERFSFQLQCFRFFFRCPSLKHFSNNDIKRRNHCDALLSHWKRSSHRLLNVNLSFLCRSKKWCRNISFYRINHISSKEKMAIRLCKLCNKIKMFLIIFQVAKFLEERKIKSYITWNNI